MILRASARTAPISTKNTCSRGSNSLNALGICWFEIPPRQLQIVMCLKIHPELRAVAKVQTEPKCRVSRDTSPVVDDLGNPVRRESDRPGELLLGEFLRVPQLFLQHFTRCDRC